MTHQSLHKFGKYGLTGSEQQKRSTAPCQLGKPAASATEVGAD